MSGYISGLRSIQESGSLQVQIQELPESWVFEKGSERKKAVSLGTPVPEIPLAFTVSDLTCPDPAYSMYADFQLCSDVSLHGLRMM